MLDRGEKRMYSRIDVISIPCLSEDLCPRYHVKIREENVTGRGQEAGLWDDHELSIFSGSSK